jgi:hypothetical protein
MNTKELEEDEFNFINEDQQMIIKNEKIKIEIAGFHVVDYVFLYFFVAMLYQPSTRDFLFSFFLYYKNQLLNRLFENDEPKEEEEEENEEPEKTPQPKPEDKYLEQYTKLESTPLSEERLATLKNTFLFEITPLGNLIMYYDHSRESFTYYSDNTIPYRFLEIASRHYVVQNNCKAVHVHMCDELTEAEKKLTDKKEKEKEKIQEEKEREKEKEKEKEKTANTVTNVTKKSVFAKMKNYNTSSIRAPNATSQKTGAIHNPNATGGNSVSVTNENKDVIVKERANRYSCEGKIVNFSFLKKVEKKIVDKRYGMSFADFKRMTKKE